jgi:hypothetical protein
VAVIMTFLLTALTLSSAIAPTLSTATIATTHFTGVSRNIRT